MKKLVAWLIVVVVLGAFAYYVANRTQKPSPPAVAKDFGVAATTPPPAVSAPPHLAEPSAPAHSVTSLPTLDDSDAGVADELSHLFGKKNLLDYFASDKIIRRFVATIDNLPRKQAPRSMMPVKPVAGSFMVEKSGQSLAIDPANAQRYAGYVDLVQAVSVPALVDLYVRLYPLCQQAYRELGFPAGQFNDRLIEVLDDLMAAPDLPPPVALVQPKVLYQYADPEIEARSAGQKIMIRLGTANEVRVKNALRVIRKEILLRVH